MRGLTIILVEAAPERFRAALILASAQAALGARARIFCQGEAAALLAMPSAAPADPAHRAAGLPALAVLLADALDLGVDLIACQSGLHLAGIHAAALDPRILAGGPVSTLQTLGDDRLLAI